MSNSASHTWIVAPYIKDREKFSLSISQSREKVHYINCHRTLRGPYSGVSELLHQLVPDIYRLLPQLVLAHKIEILSIAPELQSIIPMPNELKAAFVAPDLAAFSAAEADERNRFPSRQRTLRLAHGVVDLLLKYISLANIVTMTIAFENVDMADMLDQEFIAVLLRRADPQILLITVGTVLDSLPNPIFNALKTYASFIRASYMSIDEQKDVLHKWNIPENWRKWLVRYTNGWIGELDIFRQVANMIDFDTLSPNTEKFEQEIQFIANHLSLVSRNTLVMAYIESECTSDNLLEKAVYHLLEASIRQKLHDERANFLERLNQWTMYLGAIPFHREHGQDSSNLGVQALAKAINYSINMGYYEAVADFGYRGRLLIDLEKHLEKYWFFTEKLAVSFIALDRPAEAETIYHEARSLISNPYVHKRIAYAMAMLHARYYKDEHRNYTVAKGWMQEALVITKLMPTAPKDKAVYIAANENALALIEFRLGRSLEALKLVSDSLERLNQVLEPEQHKLHRVTSRYNRARVYAELGRLDQAIEDYTSLIEQEPYYSEYYFERGNLYRSLGRNEEALEDYNNAIINSPPYIEPYYNRAGVLSLLGRNEEALEDYNYILELDPEYIDALVNRASLLYEREEYDMSRKDIERGLTLEAKNTSLICTRGLLEMAEGHSEASYETLTLALELNPSLVAAWTNRAVLSFENGNIDAAIEDLTSALKFNENETILYNRGFAYQSQRCYQEAIMDYSRALALSSDDIQEILYQRGLCHLQMGNIEQACEDLEAHLALGSSSYLDEIQQLGLPLTSRNKVL